MLRDGTVMQVLTLEGLMFETADTQDLNHRKALRDAMLRAIGSSRFALYSHVVRRRVTPALSGDFPIASVNASIPHGRKGWGSANSSPTISI
jgi:type IV secretion system protein VirB4